MNVRDLIELLETCEPTSKISIYVPDPEDEGMEFVYEIDRVDRHFDHQECTGKPNAIGIVATERLAQLRVPDEETQNEKDQQQHDQPLIRAPADSPFAAS